MRSSPGLHPCKIVKKNSSFGSAIFLVDTIIISGEIDFGGCTIAVAIKIKGIFRSSIK